MNRFMTTATALTLGLSSCGVAAADGRTDFLDHDGFEPNRTSDSGRTLSYVHRTGSRFDWDALRYITPWWFDLDGPHFNPWWFDPNDLRHFDDWQFNDYCAIRANA